MDTAAPPRPIRLTLWAEFTALYLGAPLALWLFLPYIQLFTAIAIVTVIGVVLLIRTPGFEARELVDLHRLRETWPEILGWSLLNAAIVFSLAYALLDERFLWMARERPVWLAMLWLLYPWFSVLGQEILFRPLFFKRYGALFPSEWVAVAVNALVFALAHAFFERWITFFMSLGGGLIFALVYVRTRSFSAAFVVHWIAGGLVFTSGLGWFFFHGAIGR